MKQGQTEAAVNPAAEGPGGQDVPVDNAGHGHVNTMEYTSPDELLFVHAAFMSAIMHILARGSDHESYTRRWIEPAPLDPLPSPSANSASLIAELPEQQRDIDPL